MADLSSIICLCSLGLQEHLLLPYIYGNYALMHGSKGGAVDSHDKQLDTDIFTVITVIDVACHVAVVLCCSYWGRRAFERHFKEWRHVNGMKAMGIPNNKDFYEVTKIEDALALWKNIQV